MLEHLGLLAHIVGRQPFGLFTDCDGTISEITPLINEATIIPKCRRSLASLTGKADLVAIVSGRAVQTLADLVDVSGAVCVGNHGLERIEKGSVVVQPQAEAHAAVVQGAAAEVKGALSDIPGIEFEDKGTIVGVHYRNCADRPAVGSRALALLEHRAREGKIRIGRGRMMLEIRPPVAFSKGAAVLVLVRQHSLRGGIYLGDDVTDADALLAIRSSQRGNGFVGLGIGVMGDETPLEVAEAADFVLDGPRDRTYIHELNALPRISLICEPAWMVEEPP